MSVADAAAAGGVMESTLRRWIEQCGGVVDAPVVSSGRLLSLTEREEIAVRWAQGWSKAAIARLLGRHRATIGRELARNRLLTRFTTGPGEPPRRPGRRRKDDRPPQHEVLRYRALHAQTLTDERARRPKTRKLAGDRRLHAVVTAKLRARWSPEQIAAKLPALLPNRPEARVSHETIYQALYVQGRGGLRRELTTALRTGRAIRRPQARADARRSRQQALDMVNISQRPAEATDRAVPGHWEGDLIIGGDGTTAIGTLVERASRFLILLHLPAGNHTAATVRDAMIPAIRALPAHLRRSLTWDQGIEMAFHQQISLTADIPIFFCDPHSPWQRGSNENTNGLLRQYFPKGTRLDQHTRGYLDAVAAELNTRPRKTLGWDTPAETLAKFLDSTPTTGVATTG
jgi:IS30 family transposase